MQQVKACEEGEHGTPAEPPQGPRRQFLHGVRLGIRLGFLKIFGLYEVEIVKHADPDNTEQDMRPPENEFENHCSLLVVVNCASIVHR
jgi:hypothetical protein